MTKYYSAGASKVAMRKVLVPQYDTLTYLVGDHLGSTSLTTDSTGTLVAETRYREASLWDKPWGEVRYTTENSTLPTRYTYTGQYSYMDDEATDLGGAGFGLMFYNARWYDPALGRFAQADTIIPQHQGIQAWDRFAYTNNNPVRYSDPSGHMLDDGDGGGDSCGLNCVVKTTITVRKIKNNPANNDVVGVPVPQPPGSLPVPTLTETTIVQKTTTTTIMDPVQERIILYEDENDLITIGTEPGGDLGDAPLIGPFDPQWVDPRTGERKDDFTLQMPFTAPSRTVTTQTQTNVIVTTYDQKGEVLSSVPTENVTSETHVEVPWGGGWVPREVFLRMYQDVRTK